MSIALLFLRGLLFVLAVAESGAGAELPICAICPADSWCGSGAGVQACPAYTSSAAGSMQISDCECLPGYYGTAGADCAVCPAGRWCPGGNLNTSTVCMADASSPQGSSSVDDCVCVTRFHDHDGNDECLQCPVFGMVDSVADPPLVQRYVSYIDPAHSAETDSRLASATGGWAFSRALDPAAVFLEIDLLADVDMVGVVTAGGGASQQQWVSAFSFLVRADGSADWLNVTSGSIAPDAQGYTVFPGNSRNGDNYTIEIRFDEIYLARYIRIIPMEKPPVSCSGCYPSDSPLVRFRAGVLLMSPGAICAPCPAGECCDASAQGNPHSTCVSDPGNQDPWVPCIECGCVPGFYGPAGHNCTACPAGHYCPGGDSAVLCPVGSDVAVGGSSADSDCACLPGYFGSGGANCSGCPAGSYCPGGPVAPAACPADSDSPPLSTAVDNCTCVAGTHDHDGDHVCLQCPVYVAADSICQACSSADRCCDGGELAHMYSACAAGPVLDPWVPCPACGCVDGYFGADGRNCSECPDGHFCVNGTKTPCTACGDGVGVYRACTNTTDSICVACPANSTLRGGSTKLSDCVCDPGFRANGTSPGCIACELGDWCLDGVRRACPGTSKPFLAQGWLPSCLCAPGHTFVPQTGACARCSDAEYCLNNAAGPPPAAASVANLSAPCSDNETVPAAGARVAEAVVVGSGAWFSLSFVDILANSFEVTLYPGQYAEEYVEVCSAMGCFVPHHCRGTCPPVRLGGRRLVVFGTRLVRSVHLYTRELEGDGSGKITVLSTALFHFTAVCGCSNRELLCPAVCPPAEELQAVSWEACGCVDGFVDLYPSAGAGVQRCFPCPTGAFCQGGAALLCPPGTETYVRGAANASLCACSPGAYDTGAGGCAPCPSGHYCQRGQQYVCPNGFSTLATGSESATDCVGLLVRFTVERMDPFASLNATWVPVLGGPEVPVASVEGNASVVHSFTVERFVPLSDGSLRISTGVRPTADVYTYCVGGSCTETAAPDSTGCPAGLYANVRVNPWRSYSAVTVKTVGGVPIPYCGSVDCYSSYHYAQDLLFYTADGATALSSSDIYSTPDGFWINNVNVFGTVTLRWRLSADLGYTWSAWEFRVVSEGFISCLDASSAVEIQWASAQDSAAEGPNGGTLLKTSAHWALNTTFTYDGDVFLYIKMRLSGQCSTTVGLTELQLAIREVETPCLPLNVHQNTLPGVYYFYPGVHEAQVVIRSVDIEQQGALVPACRVCPRGFYCAGGSHLEHCARGSNTADTGAKAETDCLCGAGYTGSGSGCETCSIGEYKPLDLSDGVCSSCSAQETTAGNGTLYEEACLCLPGYTAALNATGCSPCDVGLFKADVGNGLCSVCPDFSCTAASGALALSNCECDPGYTPDEAGQCAPCAAGTFKPGLGNGACSPCPENTYSPHIAAVNASTCSMCPVGTIGDAPALVSLEQCETCPADSYFALVGGVRVCVACPDYSAAAAGSVSVANCSCVPGFYLSNASCVPCSAGSHKPELGNGACSLCPAGTFEPRVGSSAGGCLQCALGTYQPVVGAVSEVACVFCPTGTYGAMPAATNVSADCLPCPPHSTSTQGSASLQQCRCLAGYYNDGVECVPCAVGYYKDFVGDAVCEPCPNRASTVGTGSAAVHHCVCDVGFFSTELGCAPCPVGTFKDAVAGAPNCTACPARQTTLSPGSTALSACVCGSGVVEVTYNATTMVRECASCHPDSYQATVGGASVCESCFAFALAAEFSSSRDACQCVDSFVQQSWGACECPPGAFLNGSACAPCPVGTYNDQNSTVTTCTTCQPFSTTLAEGGASAAACRCFADFEPDENGTCVCAPGMEFVGGVCVECTLSMYKERGMAACAACPQYSRTVVTGATHQANCSCMETFVGSPTDGCVCDSGDYFATGPPRCEPCPAATFSSVRGLQTVCTDCPAHSVTNGTAATNETDCLCVGGYGLADGLCYPCVAGAYSAGPGREACAECPLHTWSPSVASQCFCVPGYAAATPQDAPVPAGEQAEMAGSFVADGLREPSAQCAPCPKSSFKDAFGNTGCSPCVEHSTTADGELLDSASDCLCVAGYARNGSAGCAPCPLSTFKESIANFDTCSQCTPNSVTLETGAVSALQCVCGAGAEPANGTECGLCDTVSFKAAAANEACSACPPYSQAAAPGAGAVELCECLPSFVGNSSGGCWCAPGRYLSLTPSPHCALCVVGSYSEHDTLETECPRCPPNSTTLGSGASSLASECLCGPGLQMNTATWACENCPAGSFKANYSGPCAACAPDSTSLAGADSEAGCQCVPGTQRAGDLSCEPCPAGTYSGNISDAPCQECPPYSTAPNGTGNSFCIPGPGYCLLNETLVDGATTVRVLRRCEPGTYKSVTGDVPCTPCPPYTTSEPGTTSLAGCTADIGFGGNGGGLVEPCTLGYYCPGGGQEIACPEFSTGTEGATDVLGCLCNAGYTASGGACVPCAIDTFKPITSNDACLACGINTTGFDSYVTTCGATGQTSHLECRRAVDCADGSFTPPPQSQGAAALAPGFLVSVLTSAWVIIYVSRV